MTKMYSSHQRPVIATLVIFAALSAAPAAAQALEGSVRGVVTDASGAVLPGVTVGAIASDGKVLATTVTDEMGSYALRALPAGPARVTFELEGFATATTGIEIHPGADSLLSQRLALATIAQTVVVYGKAPVDPPRPTPPPPRPSVIPVPGHDRFSVCGPAKSDAAAAPLGTIDSRLENAGELYSAGDQLLIDGGTATGLDVGKNLAVRRHYRIEGVRGITTAEHTSGLVQIVAAEETMSLAMVVYACDEIMKGDFLASFTPEPLRTPDPAGVPAYWDAARILFADAGQMLGTTWRLLVIDRGADHGLRAGQRLTIFRRVGRGALTPSVVGDAVVVAVRGDSATIRVVSATDSISFGDWAAPHRYSPAASPLAATSPDDLPR
jgi:hypothetical protein